MTRINQITIEILRGNILEWKTVAVVHETDSGLSVSKAWANTVGDAFVQQANMIGWCDIGNAVLNDGGKKSGQKIIHAVAPKWGDASAKGKLANVTWEILRIAEDSEIASVTIPPIATGINGYPVENCAKVMLEQIVDFTFEPLKHLNKIVICVATEEEYIAFSKEFQIQLDDLVESGESDVIDAD